MSRRVVHRGGRWQRRAHRVASRVSTKLSVGADGPASRRGRRSPRRAGRWRQMSWPCCGELARDGLPCRPSRIVAEQLDRAARREVVKVAACIAGRRRLTNLRIVASSSGQSADQHRVAGVGVEDPVKAHVEADHRRVVGAQRRGLRARRSAASSSAIGLRRQPVARQLEGVELDALAHARRRRGPPPRRPRRRRCRGSAATSAGLRRSGSRKPRAPGRPRSPSPRPPPVRSAAGPSPARPRGSAREAAPGSRRIATAGPADRARQATTPTGQYPNGLEAFSGGHPV